MAGRQDIGPRMCVEPDSDWRYFLRLVVQNIEVKSDLPGVGRNLQDHPAVSEYILPVSSAMEGLEILDGICWTLISIAPESLFLTYEVEVTKGSLLIGQMMRCVHVPAEPYVVRVAVMADINKPIAITDEVMKQGSGMLKTIVSAVESVVATSVEVLLHGFYSLGV